MRWIAIAMLLVACAGAPRLSRFATTIRRVNDASTLSEEQHAWLEGSLGDRPSRERVTRRLALLASAPERLSADEARALLESTLDWIDWARRGEVPDWVEPMLLGGDTEGVLDVIGMLDDTTGHMPSAIERTTTAIRETRALIEHAATGAETMPAWRAAMIALHGASDECGEEGEEGAVATAVRAHDERIARPIRSVPNETTFYEAPVSCHVATLDGGVRLTREAGEPFARATAAGEAIVVTLGSTTETEELTVVSHGGTWRTSSR